MGAADNLVIEDGTNVSGANSYITLDEFFTYVDNRELSLSAGSDHDYLAALLIKATDYIESFRGRFKGDKANDTQALQFPRDDLYIDCVLISNTAIPTELKNAQASIAYDLDAMSLTKAAPSVAASEKGDITKEKVGEIEVEYDSTGNRKSTPTYNDAMGWLRPMLRANGLTMVKL
jgi:hypothetical protein